MTASFFQGYRRMRFNFGLLLILGVLCSPAQAVTVADYFSVQEQASVANVKQDDARNSLNGLHAGLKDGLLAALFFGEGIIEYKGEPMVCVDDLDGFNLATVSQAIKTAIGTYERPILSPRAAAKMPVGVHAVIGLSQMYPCTPD